jgi:hypothetical protein
MSDDEISPIDPVSPVDAPYFGPTRLEDDRRRPLG